MRIRTRLNLTIWLSMATLTVGSCFIVLGIWQANAMVRETTQRGDLVQDLLVLRMLTMEYIARPSDRTERQWRSQYETYRASAFRSPDQPAEIRESSVGLLSTFDQIVRSSTLQVHPSEAMRLEALRQQMLASLLTETQRIVDTAEEHADRTNALQRQTLVVGGSASLLALLALTIVAWRLLFSSKRHIVSSIQKLENGAQLLSRGKLEHRIQLPSPDEFGALAASFNAMATDLQAFYRNMEIAHQAQRLEAIGTLAGGIAHDFNNLLAAVIGNAELALQRKAQPEAVVDSLQQILRASERATDLVRQILSFSRTTEQQARPIHVKPIIKEAMKLMRASIPTSITIRQELVSDSMVLADPSELHRILVNLCTNSAFAMHEGGVLDVSLQDEELDATFVRNHTGLAPGTYLRLAVVDTGAGMPPEVVSRIFEPFYTTRKDKGGTGMGLSVVHGLVKGRGGTIAVESEEGKGTLIAIYLPIQGSGQERPEIQMEQVAFQGSERILFVDDESMLADLSQHLLGDYGYRVTACNSSLEALALFEAHPQDFDLVVTDLTMPHLTGDLLAQAILKIRPDLPVILCTGHSEGLEPGQGLPSWCCAVLLKPFTGARLAQTIRRALDQPPT
jgi:signal transduction histidine kinase